MIRSTLIALVALSVSSVCAQVQRTVAVTLDDLPYAGKSMDDVHDATEAFLAVLAAHDAVADVFVVGNRVEDEGEEQARRDLLRRWRDAGHFLQNHSYSHLRYSSVEVASYLADVERGHGVVAELIAEVPSLGPVRFFRAPFNDLGKTAATRTALNRSLDKRGVQLAPFTVEHGDWMFNAVYVDAVARDDSALAQRVGQAYLTQLDTAFDFAERLSDETFGREIPQVFLIHANRINADHLDAMLERLKSRDYEFVTLQWAVSDPAYASTDEYLARWGVSWIHRWRVALGLPNALRDEPEPPPWLVEAYQALSR